MSVALVGMGTALALSSPATGAVLVSVAATNIASHVIYDKIINHRKLQADGKLDEIVTELQAMSERIESLQEMLYGELHQSEEDEYGSSEVTLSQTIQWGFEGVSDHLSLIGLYDKNDISPDDTAKTLPRIIDELQVGIGDAHLHINAIIPKEQEEYNESWHVS